MSNSLIAGMMASDIQEKRQSIKLTILHRLGGKWDRTEIGRLVNGLMTEVQGHPQFPEYVILYGHHTREEMLKALWGGEAYTVTPVTGIDDVRLPWRPTGWVI